MLKSNGADSSVDVIYLILQRQDFEQQKASLLKQQYLCNSPLLGHWAPGSIRNESLSEYAVK